ncbi:hypothetical protein pb186bvf_003364 [Paramecium bursaria]
MMQKQNQNKHLKIKIIKKNIKFNKKLEYLIQVFCLS